MHKQNQKLIVILTPKLNIYYEKMHFMGIKQITSCHMEQDQALLTIIDI